jgi:cell division septation protein DedD
MIAASIGAGIALGIVGYLFFTAGTQQTTARKRVTRVLPGPVAVAPSAPAAPADKPNIIPEIPVKQEQQAPGTAQTKEARIEEPSPAGAKNPEKKEVPHRQPAKEAVLKSGAADTAYYVQAGVFENRDNAVALAARIKEAGFAASIQNVDSAGRKRLFRVIAGSSTTREKAAELSASLSRKGIKTIVRTQ